MPSSAMALLVFALRCAACHQTMGLADAEVRGRRSCIHCGRPFENWDSVVDAFHQFFDDTNPVHPYALQSVPLPPECPRIDERQEDASVVSFSITFPPQPFTVLTVPGTVRFGRVDDHTEFPSAPPPPNEEK